MVTIELTVGPIVTIIVGLISLTGLALSKKGGHLFSICGVIAVLMMVIGPLAGLISGSNQTTAIIERSNRQTSQPANEATTHPSGTRELNKIPPLSSLNSARSKSIDPPHQ